VGRKKELRIMKLGFEDSKEFRLVGLPLLIMCTNVNLPARALIAYAIPIKHKK
jgi:hypothetical protein